MIRRILNLYRFTISEQKSLVLLCVILVIINGAAYLKGREPEGIFPFIPTEEKQVVGQKLVAMVNTREPPKSYSGKKQKVQKPVLEINVSDSIDFLTLYGIGPVYAGRIIKYRSLLGGYYSCDQLLEVYGMDSLRYKGFRKRIRVDTAGIKQININTSGFRELLRHPYLDYDAVKQLVQYRDRKGPISSPGELWKDSILSEDIRTKLLPYLKSR